MSEEKLIEKIQKGESNLFAKIIDLYEKRLFFYIKRITNWDTLSIEDMVAETFVKTYRNLQGFDVKKKFSSWIYRVAHNVAVDFLKSQKTKTLPIEDFEEVLEVPQKLIVDEAIENEKKEEVAKNLQKLNMKYKEVLLLYYMEERSYEEISEILQIPVSSVGVLLLRAKRKLKEVYEKK